MRTTCLRTQNGGPGKTVPTLHWFFIAVAAIMIVAAYPYRVWASCPNLGGTVRLLVPENFESFVYESSLRGRHTRHRFGEDATDQLRVQLNPLFTSIAVEHVDSGAEAKRMLASGDFDWPDMRGYDLIAIPEFRNVNFWAKGQHYGFDIDMVVEFYSRDSSKVTRIRGYGESNTGFYAASNPGKSGSLALSKAVEAVADGVCEAGNSLF